MFFVLFFPQAPATADIPTPHQSHLKGGRFHLTEVSDNALSARSGSNVSIDLDGVQ